MGLIRYCIVAALCVCAIMQSSAQQVWYPEGASQLLKSTAEDVAMLLQKAGAGKITAAVYSKPPVTGWVLVYDASLKDNQACRVKSDGTTYIQFSAAEDNGLNFGVYQYMHQLGFRFYQPGTIWEIIPALQSPYKKTDTLYSSVFRYKNWFISGGYNKWKLDKTTDYDWDMYTGQNGHDWALYMRRNNMLGINRFAGHRDDIITEEYLGTLKSNPCFVAPYDGSRQANRQSVPDINNINAMQYWSDAIEKKFTQYKNTIFNNKNIYPNLYHNFSYAYGNIGIEVPDGAHWANSTDNSGCSNTTYVTESDQHFTLANFTALKLKKLYPEKRYQLYAYDGHADVPSAKIPIDENIDIQVVSTGFQNETSAKGLLNRWYSRAKNVSEYHYLNLPQWSGETPSFFLDDLKTTVQRLKTKKAQGIVWEASPAKFASLPFLLAANNSLKDNAVIDNTLHEFCDQLFGGASSTIYLLLQLWSDDKTVMIANGIQDNKYKLPLYFELVDKATGEIMNDAPVVKERLRELKAYLHYLVLYYDWKFDQRDDNLKTRKASALCNYLARIHHLEIVNSYYLVTNIVSKYSSTDSIYAAYNVVNGTAYSEGAFSMLTEKETGLNFEEDLLAQRSQANDFAFTTAPQTKALLGNNNLVPLEKINVKINYTNAKDYATRAEFYMIADGPGSFSIQYTPFFNMAEKGYINFTVEEISKELGVIKDFTINNKNEEGVLVVVIPAAGTYKLSVVSKYKSAMNLVINTNGNYFYKKGPYLGNTTENYRSDLSSLPGYFYVPPGIKKIYFSLNNSNPGGKGFASPAEINKAFMFKNNQGAAAEAQLVNSSDSAFFYLNVPAANSGSFWQAVKMEQYRLCFANISNLQWYAEKKTCTEIDFSVDFKKFSGECIMQLKSLGSHQVNNWKIYDTEKLYEFTNKETVDLPAQVSPNAMITLTDQSNCSVTRRLGDMPVYLANKEKCAAGSAAGGGSPAVVIYPNPGSGIFRFKKDNELLPADEILIFNNTGARVACFTNTHTFNISNLPGGVYWYQVITNKTSYRGKLVKL